MHHLIDADRCVVVLVDYQARLLPALHDGDRVVAEALCLADAALALGLRVVGTEQNPPGLGRTVEALRSRCETTLPKMHFDACADGLLALLRPSPSSPDGAPLPDVVVAGCEAHVCLLQTALGLLGAGHRVWVVATACGSRSPTDHALAMRRLAQAGAVVASVEMVVFEWLRSCRHERFKAVLPLMKARGPGAAPHDDLRNARP